MNASNGVNLKNVWRVFYPIVLMTFIAYLTNFLEKVMFGYLSPELIQASVETYFISWIFQTCGIRFASLAQVNVGRWYGAGEYHKIGQGVWQFVWFSILSVAVTFPLGFWMGRYYFQGTPLASSALPYLNFYLIINFIYPLKAALTGFYLGIGKIKWVTSWTIGSHVLQLALDYLFILGAGGWMPSFGLIGGGLSTLVSQGGLSLWLLFHFIKSENRNLFSAHLWQCRPRLLVELIKPGLFRVVSQFLQGTAWASLSLVIASCSTLHASVLAVGISVFYLLACFGDALQLSMVNLNTRLLGSRAFHALQQTLLKGLNLIILLSLALAIPLLFFPQPVFHLFFPKVLFNSFEIQMVLGGIWALGTTYCITSICAGFILAFKDVQFLLLNGIWGWVFDYGVATMLGIKILGFSPLSFWFLIAFGHLLGSSLYYLRIRWLCNSVITLEEKQISQELS